MFRAFELVAKFLALVLLTALPAGCALLPLGSGAALVVILIMMALVLAGFVVALPALLLLKFTGRLTKTRFVGVAICAGAAVGSILGIGDYDSGKDPIAAMILHTRLAISIAFLGMGFGGWSALLALLLFGAQATGKPTN